MVKDPIEFTGSFARIVSDRIAIANKINEPLFYMAHIPDDECRFLIFRQKDEMIIFSIRNEESELYYIVEDNRVSRAECATYIEEHYPEHFEWLLFHPEWL